jgi:hypothetical protein
MLKVIKLDSWADYEKIIEHDLLHRTQNMVTGPYFYRGHPDARWKLATTLERSLGPNQSVIDYYLGIKNIQSQIETFTDHHWNLPSFQEYMDNLKNDSVVMSESITIYMQYLRHFGYPSPLLDWTYSPFVAAYFAFKDIANTAESIAIYQLLAASELWLNQPSRIIVPENAIICPISTSSQKNKRHYLQQSVYTVCLQQINDQICYASHEDPHIIGGDEEDDNSPYGEGITKYIIPASERITALQSLDAYNMNAYSLMGTEESLLETLFLQDYKNKEIEKNIWSGKY